MVIEDTLWIGCDNYIPYFGAQDAYLGTYLNTGTVTYTLYDSTGATPVSGASGSCSYVSSSNGNYLGTMDAAVSATLTDGTDYLMKFVFNQSTGGYDDTRYVMMTARKRGKV